MESNDDVSWKFKQCFGEQRCLQSIQESDMLTTVEFSENGDFIATGDRAGRVVIFEQNHRKREDDEDLMDFELNPPVNNFPLFSQDRSKYRKRFSHRRTPTYRFQAEFKSHSPEFDGLKSLEIEEKLNKIKWCRPTNDALFLLTTNDKTIKLWKVTEHHSKLISNKNLESDLLVSPSPRTPTPSPTQPNPIFSDPSTFFNTNSQFHGLKIPRAKNSDRKIKTQEKRVYANGHAYHINGLAVCNDGETFLSSDDLRVNILHLNSSDEVYNIIDIKPDNMDELMEVITSCEAHPFNTNLFIYCSSRGTIKLHDLRANSNCDKMFVLFKDNSEEYKSWVSAGLPEDVNPQNSSSFFQEILASISDIKFSRDGNSIVSRDYLSVKIWDVRKNDRPVEVINFLDHLKPKLRDLARNDYIYDKFEVSINANSNLITTGSYNNNFYVFDQRTRKSRCVNVVTGEEPTAKYYGDHRLNSSVEGEFIDQNLMQLDNSENIDPAKVDTVQMNQPDDRFAEYRQKAMHLAIHPEMNCLAVAVENNLYI